jgi:hypothetical protein
MVRTGSVECDRELGKKAIWSTNPFLGSGTTLAAAEVTERVCCGLELDPKYVDVIVQRWQDLSGKKATLDAVGRSFEEVARERVGQASFGGRLDGKSRVINRKQAWGLRAFLARNTLRFVSRGRRGTTLGCRSDHEEP